jgi:hypothetical protein
MRGNNSPMNLQWEFSAGEKWHDPRLATCRPSDMELQGVRAHPAGLGPVADSQEMTIRLALPCKASDG